MPVLREKNLQDKLEIYIDGGIRRATDIIKALCLGAKGVGIGRPFLFAMSAYGLPGVDRAMQLLKDEMIMNMRLIGAQKVEDLTPEACILPAHSGAGGAAMKDRMSRTTASRFRPASSRW